MPLTLKNVSFAYDKRSDRAILPALNLTFAEGTVTLLVGRTGSGKSTLLKLLAGLLMPTGGEILLDGKRLFAEKGLVPRGQALQLGWTSQYPEEQLFAADIRGELRYSFRPYSRNKKRLDEMAREVCSTLDLDPGESPFALSGGQKRRLALASALVPSPRWLLLDEPSAAMEAQAVQDLLSRVKAHAADPGQRNGVIIATHDLDLFFPVADRVIVLHGGRVLADATPASLCRNPAPLYAAEVGPPSCVVLANALSRHGISVPAGPMTPSETTAAIADQLKNGLMLKNGSTHTVNGSPQTAAVLPTSPPSAEPVSSSPDPRAKWIFYTFFILAVALQSTWAELLLSASLLAVFFRRQPSAVWRGLWRIARPFAIFAAISVLLAGMEWHRLNSGFHFSPDRANLTGFRVFQLFLFLWSSYWLTGTTPFMRLMQGMDWLLGWLRRMRIPAGSFALATSFTFRFLPMIQREWERFSLIVRARGKAGLKPGIVRVRDLPALIIPLVLSLFHRTEEIVTALELKKTGLHVLCSAPLGRWGRNDWLLAALGGGWLGFVILWKFLL